MSLWNFTNGIKQIWRWLPVIWHDADYDWAYLAKIMEAKLRWMAEDAKGWHSVNADKDRKNMLICAELLRRQVEGLEFYVRNALGGIALPANPYSRAQIHEREDLHYLGTMLGKHMTTWWD